jgi:hypothetical protein
MSEIDDIISGGSIGAVSSTGQPQGIPSTFNAETADNDESVRTLPLSYILGSFHS